MEYFIMLDSVCIVHYLVFAKLMALPQCFSYLFSFRIGFYISEPVRYDKSFSSLLSSKKCKLDFFFFFNSHHLKIKVTGNVCINACWGAHWRTIVVELQVRFSSLLPQFLFSNVCVFYLSLEPHSSKTHSVRQR